MVAIVSGNGFGLATGSAGVLGQSGVFGNPNLGNTREATYVNIATGNLVLRDQDDFIAALGADISLTRTYNSLGALGNGTATGWRNGLVKQVAGLTGTVNTAGSTITRIDGDGSAALYRYDTTLGVYVGTDGGGGYDHLAINADQEWVWTSDRLDKAGIHEVYSTLAAGGNIKSVNDQGGVRLTYRYDAQNRVSQVLDASGDVMFFVYNSNGYLSQVGVGAPGGTSSKIYYFYDSLNRLTMVQNDLTPDKIGTTDGDNYITQYTYRDNSSQIASIWQQDGTKLTLGYTQFGADWKVSSVTDGLNQITRYDYGVAGQTTVTDPLNNRTVYAYDGAGQLLSVTVPAVGTAAAQVTGFRYDAQGNVKTVTDARGLSTTYEYDANGNRILETGAAGDVVTRSYDLVTNRLLSETRWPNGNAVVAGQPAPLALTTSYAYDSGNRLRFTVSPERRVQEVIYTGNGLRSSVIDYAGALLPAGTTPSEAVIAAWAAALPVASSTINRTDYGYDSRGLVTKTSTYVMTRAPQVPFVPGTLPAGFTSTDNNITFITKNQTAATYTPLPGWAYQPLGTTFRFDMTTPATLTKNMVTFGLDGSSQGQRFRLMLNNGNINLQSGNTQKYEYPWVISTKANTTYAVEITTDVSGKAVLRVYEKSAGPAGAATATFNFLPGTQVRLAGNTESGTSLGGPTLGDVNKADVTNIVTQAPSGVIGSTTTARYVYDLRGQLLQTIDGNDKTTATYTYDGLGRQLTATDSLGNTSVSVYNTGTRSVQLTQANGLVSKSIFDANGQVLSATQSDAQGTVLSVAANSYDKDGRLRLNVVNGQSTYLLYDAADRRIASIDANGNLTAFFYNADNQVSRTIAYDQRINTAQLRDAAGNWLEVGLDKLGLQLSNSRSTWSAYDKAGRLAATVDANGSVTRYVYDNASRLLQVIQRAVPIVVGTLASTYATDTFTDQTSTDDQISRNYYDKDGKLLAQVDAAGYLTEYRYDGLGQRVESIRRAVALTQASLNANPALTTLVAASGVALSRERYFYNIKNQLAATLDNNNFLTTLAYDVNGNISSRRRYAAAVTAPAAATLAQLGATANDGLDVVTGYTYTTRNELETETTAGITTRYTYDKVGKLLEKRVGLDNGLNRKQTQMYDLQGNLTAELNAEGSAALVGLAKDSAEAKAVWDKYATEYTYNGNGLRLTATDPNGNKTRYYYDAAGNLTHSVNALGEVSELVYSNFGQVLSKTSYGTRIGATKLALLEGGQAAADLVALVAGLRDPAIDSTQSYEYDGDGRQLAMVDASGYRDTVKYDNFGRVESTEQQRVKNGNDSAPSTNPGSRSVYDLDGRLIASISADGLLTAYSYNALDQLTDRVTYAKPVGFAITAADLKTLLANPAAQRDNARDMHQRFFYDGLVTTVMTAKDISGTQVNWSVVKNTYDGLGNLVSRTAYAKTLPTADTMPAAAGYPARDAADSTVLYAYDNANRLSATATSQNAADANPATPIDWLVVRNSYDAIGNLAATTAYATPLKAAAPTTAQFNQYAVANPADATTYYTYDSAGRVKTVATAQSVTPGTVYWAVTGRTYDTAGNLATSTQYATAKTTASAQIYPVTAPVVDAANDRTTTYRYDAANRLQVTIDAAGGVTRLDYDARGNLTQRTSYFKPAAASTVTAAYQPALTADDRVTRTIYDRENRPTFTIDPLGQVSEQRYDEFGNIAATRQYAEPLSAAEFAALTPLTATLTSLRATPGIDRQTRYAYDRQGKLRFTVDPAGYLKENVYTALGQLAETRDLLKAPGIVFAEPLDVAVMTAEVTRQIAAKSVSINSFTYDGAGNLVTSTDALRVSESWGYDALGRKTSFTNKAGNTWTYVYDAGGHLIRETSPQVTSYAADFNAAMGAWGAGIGEVMVTTMQYDTLGNLSKRTEAAGTRQARATVYGYDLVGRQTSTVLQSVKIYDTADPKSAANAAVWEKDSGIRINTVGYNSFGEAVSNRDAAGNISYKVYDLRGQVRYDVDAMGYVTGYDHNAFGDVTALTRYNTQAAAGATTPDTQGAAAFKDRVRTDAANDRTIRNGYDGLGRLIKTSEPVTAVFDQHSTTSSPYIDAGKTTENVYNRFGEVRAQLVYGASAIAVAVDGTVSGGARLTDAAETRNVYDLRGNRTAQLTVKMAAADGRSGTGYVTTYQYGWDGVNRVVTQTEYSTAVDWNDSSAYGGTAPKAAPGLDRDTSSAYDLAGRLVRQSKLNATFVRNGQQVTENIDTRYGYDALGNQTLVSDALGGNSYTYYDKLGRAIAVAKYQTAGVAGVAAAPPQLTEFKLDILGNIALRIEYAAGASGTGAPAEGQPPAPANAEHADNRVTMSHYNLDGRAVEVQDAEQFDKGAAASIIRTSYDVLGHSVKQWRTVTSGGAVQTAFQITRYDALGRVEEVETPPNVDLVNNSAQLNTRKINSYNAFGEIVATSVISGDAVTAPPTATKYDQAGRAWHTNAADGVDTVTLFDAQGHATARIRSTSTDVDKLHELGKLGNAMAARAVVQQLRTDTQYDLTGRQVDSRPASELNSVLRWQNGAWVKSTAGYTESLADGVLVIGRRDDTDKNFSVRYRLKPDGAWVNASERLQTVDGYPAFSTGGLASGDYEYQVVAQPAGETQYVVSTGALRIDTTSSSEKNRQVVALYMLLLGRTPAAPELNYWVAAFNEGATLASIAGDIYVGTEATTYRAGNNATAVRLLFQNAGRPQPADADYNANLTAWTARLDHAAATVAGPARTAAIGQVLGSLAFASLPAVALRVSAVTNYLVRGGSDQSVVDRLLANAGTAPDGAISEGTRAAQLESQRRQLARLYLGLFARAPDKGGFDFWAAALGGGATIESVALDMLKGDESRRADVLPDSLTTDQYNERFVTLAYTNLMGRAPTAAELAEAKAGLGAPRSAAHASFLVNLGSRVAGDTAGGAPVDPAARTLLFQKTVVALAYAAMPSQSADIAQVIDGNRAAIAAMGTANSAANAAHQATLFLQTRALAAKAAFDAAVPAAAATPLETLRLQLGRMYAVALNRAPDRDGFTFWLNQLKTNVPGTLQSILADVLAHEGANAALYPPSLTDTQFITRVFSMGMGLAAGSTALNNAVGAWVPRAAGQSRAKLMLDIINSVVLSSDPRDQSMRNLLNNKAAVGVTYAVNFAGSDLNQEQAILQLVTDSDITAALQYGSAGALQIAAEAALAMSTAAKAAAAQTNTNITAVQGVVAAKVAVTAAQTAADANPLAAPLLRAAQLYVTLLGRGSPGKAGLDLGTLSAMAQQMAAGATDVAMAQSLLDSVEGRGLFPTTDYNPAQFITQMYQLALGREPERSGLEYWTARAPTLASRAQIAVDMVKAFLTNQVADTDPNKMANQQAQAKFYDKMSAALSAVNGAAVASASALSAALASATDADTKAKAAASTALAAVNSANGVANTNARKVLEISRLYVGILKRGAGNPIDVYGLNYWTRALVNGGATLESIANDLLNSVNDGKILFAGATTNRAFINQIYQQVLGRTPADDDTYWLDKLNSGLSRGLIASGIITSLTEQTYQAESEYLAKANFNQRVGDAMSVMSGTAAAEATRAANALTSALDLKNITAGTRDNALDALNATNALTVEGDPNVIAAKEAAPRGAAFLAAANVKAVTELLVAFKRPADFNIVYALALGGQTGDALMISIIRPLVMTLADRPAFFRDLYTTILGRTVIEQGGIDYWLRVTAAVTDPASIAYDFYKSALNELTNAPQGASRPAFKSEFAAVKDRNQTQATNMANGYAPAQIRAANEIKQKRDSAQTAYNNSIAPASQAYNTWLDASSYNAIATRASAALTAAGTVQTATVKADKAAAASLAAAALMPGVAASLGLPASTTLADYTARSTTATNLQKALGLDSTLGAAQAARARASAALTSVVQNPVGTTPQSLQVASVTQMYTAVLNRAPTLLELNLSLGSLKNGKTAADLVNALIAANPAVYPVGMTNDAFVTKVYWQAMGRGPDADGLRYWSDPLNGAAGLSRGALVMDMIHSMTVESLNSDTLAYNTRVAAYLTTLSAQAQDAATPAKLSATLADFVAANTAAARLEATNFGAAAQAALPPAALYETELTQLYVSLLGRSPEPLALLSAISQRSTGVPLTKIVTDMLDAPETRQRFAAGISDTQFVTDFYRLGLGRAADPAELAAALALLAGGKNTRGQVVISLIKDLYAYNGNDALKAATRTAFMARVSTSLERSVIELDRYRAALDTAAARSADMEKAAILTRMADGTLLGRDSVGSGLFVQGTARTTLDRWGNVLSVADVRYPNWKISYQYNYDNQRIDATLNALAGSSNVAHSATGYDALGRQVLTTDYNNNTNTQSYDANGNVAAELHADTGTVAYTYDLFGNRTSMTRQRGGGLSALVTRYAYDHLNHLTTSWSDAAVVSYAATSQHTRNLLAVAQASAQLVQRYGYDEMGRNVSRTDAAGAISLIRYDLDGNVILNRNETGRETFYSYDAFHNRTAMRDALGNGMLWSADSFGRALTSTSVAVATPDAAASRVTTTYSYDAAGQKIGQSSGRGQKIEYSYEDGLLTQIRDLATKVTTTYSYDRAGNRLTERQSYGAGVPVPARVQNNTMTYDRQNRLASVEDGVYSLRYEYDANGNRTRVYTDYGTGTIDSYNSYDSMNRQQVVNGDWDKDRQRVVYGKQGHEITYDRAGNRLTDTFIGPKIVASGGTYTTQTGQATVESYLYDGAGRLSDIQRDGVVVNQRHYDQAGRVAESGILYRTGFNGLDTVADAVGYSSVKHTYAYNSAGQMLEQRDERYSKTSAIGDLIQNVYFIDQEGRYDAVGNLLYYTISPKDRGPWENYNYHVTYIYIDGEYKEQTKRVERGATNISSYDFNGNRTAVTEQGNNKELSRLWYDAAGHVQSKREDGGAERFMLIVNGEVLGEETKTADNVLGSTYTGVASPSLSAPPSSYSVQGASETLQSIARNLWGDSKLWYLIADANGLNSDSKLAAGQILNIPTRVNTVHNDYATFKPYDAAEAMGDTTPAPPPPSSGGGCGAVGTLIMVVVAVAVTLFTAGAMTGPVVGLIGTMTAGASAIAGGGIIAGAVAAAAGSIASQAVGIAIGAQDSFSWKGVALAAIGGGVSGGLPANVGGFGNVYAQAAARAAVGNVASQGVGIMTGLQNGFDWRNVAASAAGAVAGQAFSGPTFLGNSELARRTVSGFAAGTAASIMRGGKIEVARIATDAFGNALGSSLARVNWGGSNDPMDSVAVNAEQTNSAADNRAVGLRLPTGTRFLVQPESDDGSTSEIDATAASGSSSASLTGQFDLTDKSNFKAYLNAVNEQRISGVSLDPQDVATSKALLFYYQGYAMGEQRGTADQLVGNLNDQSSHAFSQAIDSFSKSTDTEQQNRYDFYSNIKTNFSSSGQATRGRSVDVTRDDRTIRVKWDKSFSDVGGNLGVSADETLRKTDFQVYQAAINAAFMTDGVTSFNINGAWRPHPADYAAIRGTPSPLPNVRSQHISSRALDINMINDVSINNRGYANHVPSYAEPDIIQQFTNNLRDESGIRQIFQPWRMLGNANNAEARFTLNRDVTVNSRGQLTAVPDANAILHKNHLHFGF